MHPELCRRLYDDWSTLDKFQRTRGVLRLLAKVIHRLWESQDDVSESPLADLVGRTRAAIVTASV